MDLLGGRTKSMPSLIYASRMASKMLTPTVIKIGSELMMVYSSRADAHVGAVETEVSATLLTH
jgi:hypothetical protein